MNVRVLVISNSRGGFPSSYFVLDTTRLDTFISECVLKEEGEQAVDYLIRVRSTGGPSIEQPADYLMREGDRVTASPLKIVQGF